MQQQSSVDIGNIKTGQNLSAILTKEVGFTVPSISTHLYQLRLLCLNFNDCATISRQHETLIDKVPEKAKRLK